MSFDANHLLTRRCQTSTVEIVSSIHLNSAQFCNRIVFVPQYIETKNQILTQSPIQRKKLLLYLPNHTNKQTAQFSMQECTASARCSETTVVVALLMENVTSPFVKTIWRIC